MKVGSAMTGVTGLLSKVMVSITSAIALFDRLGNIVAVAGPEAFAGALMVSFTAKLSALIANYNSADGLISAFFGTAARILRL